MEPEKGGKLEQDNIDSDQTDRETGRWTEQDSWQIIYLGKVLIKELYKAKNKINSPVQECIERDSA